MKRKRPPSPDDLQQIAAMLDAARELIQQASMKAGRHYLARNRLRRVLKHLLASDDWQAAHEALCADFTRVARDMDGETWSTSQRLGHGAERLSHAAASEAPRRRRRPHAERVADPGPAETNVVRLEYWRQQNGDPTPDDAA